MTNAFADSANNMFDSELHGVPILNSKAQHLLSLRATKSICIYIIAYAAAGSAEAMGIRPPDPLARGLGGVVA